MHTVHKYAVSPDAFELDLPVGALPPDRLVFVGTAQFREGSLVFHLFEVV